MSFIDIQPNVHCEPCKDCGARPVIEQVRQKYFIRCPKSDAHYKTKSGMVNFNDWNNHNKQPDQSIQNITNIAS